MHAMVNVKVKIDEGKDKHRLDEDLVITFILF